jgi:hypothetical protein
MGGKGALGALGDLVGRDVAEDDQVVVLEFEQVVWQRGGIGGGDGARRAGEGLAEVVDAGAGVGGSGGDEQHAAEAGAEGEGLGGVVVELRVAGVSARRELIGLEDRAEPREAARADAGIEQNNVPTGRQLEASACGVGFGVDVDLGAVAEEAERADGAAGGRDLDADGDGGVRGSAGGRRDGFDDGLPADAVVNGHGVDANSGGGCAFGAGEGVAGGLVAIGDEQDAAGGIGRDEPARKVDGGGDVGAVGDGDIELTIGDCGDGGRGDGEGAAAEGDDAEQIIGAAGVVELAEHASHALSQRNGLALVIGAAEAEAIDGL